jgi:hypothetical protein
VKKVTSCVDYSTYLLWAEYGRQAFAELGERNVVGAEVAVESLEKEEA